MHHINPLEPLWPLVDIGTLVSVSLKGRIEHSGTVDDKSYDGSVVWILSSSGQRRLFHIGDGYHLMKTETAGFSSGSAAVDPLTAVVT